MASLRYAAVLVTVLVYCSAVDPLEERLQSHVNSCKNVVPTCLHQCVLKKMGIINMGGQYEASKAVEWMKFNTNIGILAEEQAIEIAKICNSVNKKLSTSCYRAEQVSVCISNEMMKLGVDQNFTPHGHIHRLSLKKPKQILKLSGEFNLIYV